MGRPGSGNRPGKTRKMGRKKEMLHFLAAQKTRGDNKRLEAWFVTPDEASQFTSGDAGKYIIRGTMRGELPKGSPRELLGSDFSIEP